MTQSTPQAAEEKVHPTSKTFSFRCIRNTLALVIRLLLHKKTDNNNNDTTTNCNNNSKTSNNSDDEESTMALKSVAVITMSTRTPRVGPQVTSVVHKVLAPEAKASGIALHEVDLATFRLPLFDESLIPAMLPEQGTYAHAASLAWSAEIKRHDGYVLVLPEYNYSLSASTKNAMDYLCHEWRGKPVAVVSYGTKGGSFAADHAAHVLGKMRLRVAPTHVNLALNVKGHDQMMPALLEGKLSPEVRQTWQAESAADILQVFREIKQLFAEDEEKKKAEAAEAEAKAAQEVKVNGETKVTEVAEVKASA